MATSTAFKISSVNISERQRLALRSGMTVRVWQKIQEKGKTRLQAYEGLVIACKHGFEAGATFTVRRVASGVGMEKIFPLYSPNIDKIEILRESKTRRSKLYYIRDKAAREIRRRMRKIVTGRKTRDEFVEQVIDGIETEAISPSELMEEKIETVEEEVKD